MASVERELSDAVCKIAGAVETFWFHCVKIEEGEKGDGLTENKMQTVPD